jgi:hypothetical protein
MLEPPLALEEDPQAATPSPSARANPAASPMRAANRRWPVDSSPPRARFTGFKTGIRM